MSGGAVGALLGEAGLARLADAGLSSAGDDIGVEVVVVHSSGGLTRFANNQIHQNTVTRDAQVSVRAATPDGRIGVAAVHTDDPAAVAQTTQLALANARAAPPDPEFAGLAPAAAVEPVEVDDITLGASPGDRAAAVREVLAEVPAGYEAAGAYRTDGTELGVYTSAGQRAYAPLSSAQLTMVVSSGTSSGYAEQGGRATSAVDAAGAARRAVEKAQLGESPVELDAGTWPVVLEPAAVGTLVQFLAYLGFGGREYLEQRSFVSGRLGEKLFDARVQLADDALAADAVGFPFDFEGTPKQRVELVRDGTLTAVVHDRHTARQAGVASTGHGLPAPNPHGPVATNPRLAPGGDGTIDDLVAGMERGLLVTRFHYTNVVHPLETSLTGMTRDGTFLVADGQVVNSVRNLRFTQSIVGALADVTAISSETAYASDLFFGGSRCPALALPAFTFTSTTTFG